MTFFLELTNWPAKAPDLTSVLPAKAPVLRRVFAASLVPEPASLPDFLNVYREISASGLRGSSTPSPFRPWLATALKAYFPIASPIMGATIGTANLRPFFQRDSKLDF